MSKPNRARRHIGQGMVWLLLAGLAFGTYRVYRWAEPSAASLATVLTPHSVSNVSLELEEADFENFAGGYKNWAIQAGRIALRKPTGLGDINTVQAADIDDIRAGKLFAHPLRASRSVHADNFGSVALPLLHNRQPAEPSSAAAPSTGSNALLSQELTQETADTQAGIPAATFTAQHGHYATATSEDLPVELRFTHTLQWEFRLTGNVHIRTREGYELKAPTILMLEMRDQRTNKIERQMLCEQGAEVKAGGATVQANNARYDDTTQTVECLGGVRSVMQADSVQSEHIYWSLKDDTLRCPEMAAGTWQGSPYTAQNVLIDARRHVYEGRKLVMQLSGNTASKLAGGTLGLMMATGVVSHGQTSQPPAVPKSSSAAATTTASPTSTVSAETFRSEAKTNVTIAHTFTYISGDRTITGDNARISRIDDKHKMLDADGHLVMDDPEHHGTGQKAHVDELKGLATITGDVVLILKPQTAAPAGDTKSDSIEGGKKHGAVVNCDQVDSYYRRKFTVLRGHLIFKQHILRPNQAALDRTGTAEHAEYDSKKEILVLFPPVEGHDSDGSEFHSKTNKVLLGTRQGEEYIEGAQGTLTFPVQEDTSDDTTETSPPVKPESKSDSKKPQQ